MNEIEIKAHVLDKQNCINKLNEFATFQKSVVKDDTYFGAPQNPQKKIRIRKETCNEKTQFYLTYKKKENKPSLFSSINTELNEELETIIADGAPLEQFFLDTGFSVELKKHKEVLTWTLDLPNLSELLKEKVFATIELCNVPPLGDFLEIEILSTTKDEKLINLIQQELFEILSKSGIEKNQIESRYYSDLLKDKNISQ